MQSTCTSFKMRFNCIAASCYLILFPFHSFSQIFPGLEGEVLVEAIQENYTPDILLSDTQIRDTLYASVFIEDDSVRCIYSGMARFLPEGVDPSQFLFGTGTGVTDINLEHGWPQTKGAGDGTNGNIDMHHLYPSRIEINSDRANYPFSEIPDQNTQKWYYLQQVMTDIPSNDINSYSEFITGHFEPRESVKGDIARAMFYFWTIYREDAAEADPDFFNLQKDDLCSWHQQDPADDFELLRNERIAFYQDGIQNPFILDCSLANRAYCPLNIDCTPIHADDNRALPTSIGYDQYTRRLMILSHEEELWNVNVINILGQVNYSENLAAGNYSYPIDLTNGFYVILASNGKEKIHSKIFIR